MSAPAPPDGFEFLGAKPSGDPRWWRMLCPACCEATVAVVRDGDNWRLAAEIGCTHRPRSCPPELIEWRHLWRLGELPPRPEPDDRARRYAAGAMRRILGDLTDKPSPESLRRAAYDCGRWLDLSGLDVKPVAMALIAAANRADNNNINVLASALTAGRAMPARLPQ